MCRKVDELKTSADDGTQGALGNCWLIAAIAALSEVAVERGAAQGGGLWGWITHALFASRSITSDGRYLVRLRHPLLPVVELCHVVARRDRAPPLTAGAVAEWRPTWIKAELFLSRSALGHAARHELVLQWARVMQAMDARARWPRDDACELDAPLRNFFLTTDFSTSSIARSSRSSLR